MSETYDVITIGRGLAGAALAKRMAENGMRVLVLEHEVAFRDRVRGEQMHCWGVTRRNKLLDFLRSSRLAASTAKQYCDAKKPFLGSHETCPKLSGRTTVCESSRP